MRIIVKESNVKEFQGFHHKHETIEDIRDDKLMTTIISWLMDLQEQENTQVPLHEQQLNRRKLAQLSDRRPSTGHPDAIHKRDGRK